MIKVIPRRNESIHATLRRFRKLLEKEGIVREMKRKTYYEKPSEERSRIKRRIKREREKELRRASSSTPTPKKKSNPRSTFQ